MINNVNKLNKKCPNNTIQYIVKSGDTLYKIATRNKTTIEILLELNPELNTNLLIPGIVMCVPISVAEPPVERPPSGMPIKPIIPPSEMPTQPMTPPSGMPTKPTTPPSETPTQPIVPPPGMPTQPIAPPSGMPTQPITPPPGMPTRPIAPPPGASPVRPMQPTTPPCGMPTQPITQPNGRPVTPFVPPIEMPMTPVMPQELIPVFPGTTGPECNGQIKYTIKHGDTLYNLARKYDITLFELLNANKNVNPYNLQIGQVICIPMSTTNCPFGSVYTVAAGDTLETILTKFRISLSNLREVNENFDPYNLRVGMRLCIPAFMAYDSCQTDRTYVIQAGDSLARISNNLMISTNDLLTFNPNMRPDDFSNVGVKICLPLEAVPYR